MIKEMDNRKLKAIDNIEKLQEETRKLKEQRPALLCGWKKCWKD